MREYEIVDGRYRIGRRIAAGGFGAIYQATDIVMGREVALKVLHRELADDAAMVARFRREADALARLRDPHTITMYDVGHAADGSHYIVLELLRGESLHAQFATTGAMPWRRVALIARGVCSSLGEAHAVGIIHRDLKPANIHLEASAIQQDFVKVLDFGIAKLVDADATAFPDLTLAGQMVGTFDYMPPEQLIGDMCTGRSDVFALAVVMYELIAGQRPFAEGQGPAGRLMAMMTTAPIALALRADVPAALDAIVMRALSHNLEDRPDIGELDALLARLIEDSAIMRRAPSVVDAVPSDISAMIDEALGDADDDDDTWVGEAPKPTVVGLAPTRAPSQPASRSQHGEEPTQNARPITTRFAVGSRTELPPAKGLWSSSESTRDPSDDGIAKRPAPVASMSMPAKPKAGNAIDNSATRRPTPVGLTPRPVPPPVPPATPSVDELDLARRPTPIDLTPRPMPSIPASTTPGGSPALVKSGRPTPVGLGAPGPRRTPERPAPVAAVSVPVVNAPQSANDPAAQRRALATDIALRQTIASDAQPSKDIALRQTIASDAVATNDTASRNSISSDAVATNDIALRKTLPSDASSPRRAIANDMALRKTLPNDASSQALTARLPARSIANDTSSQAQAAKQPARAIPHARTIVPSNALPKLPNIAFTPAPERRPTPSAMALPPAPAMPAPTSAQPTPAPPAMPAPTSAQPTPAPAMPSPTWAQPTSAPAIPAASTFAPPRASTSSAPTTALALAHAPNPVPTKRVALRYLAWTLALFGVGFAAAIAFSSI